MAFFDEARIQAISGKGGNGCLSFRREKYIPRSEERRVGKECER